MKIKCIANTGEGLSEETLEKIGGFKTSKFPVKLHENYIVYAQAIYSDVLQYLLIGSDENLPSWYPAELFEILDPLLYYEQYFSCKPNQLISAIWGFKEIVFDENYFFDLIERKDDAIRIFLKRKFEIEEFFKD